MLLNLVDILYVLVLVAGVPVLSFVSTRRAQIRLLPRSAIYLSAVISQWLLAALGVVVMFVTSRSFSATGFRAVGSAALVRWTGLLVVVSLLAMGFILLLEHRGWWPEESELVYLLVPETIREKLWSVLALAPTAAFCEEYLYRGYLLSELTQRFHSVLWAWVISSAFFGLAHIYQGFSGVVRAGLLGALLAYPVVRLGTLYPSIAAHLLIDALALGWLGPAFLRRRLSA